MHNLKVAGAIPAPATRYYFFNDTQMTAPFSIKEVFKAGWHTLRAHSGLVFAVVLTMFAIEVALQIVEKTLQNSATGATASIVLSIASAALGIGATIIALRLAEGKHATYQNIIPSWTIFWRTLVAGLLMILVVGGPLLVGAAVGAGVFFGSVGGNFDFEGAMTTGEWPWGAIVASSIVVLIAVLVAVYFALRFSMGQYAIIEGARVIESLRKSWRMTRGAMGKLVLFLLAFGLLNILGVIPLGLGLLVTIPLTSLAMAHVYLKLKHRS
ncbi:DUF975 family protein [Candidatus Nomurabacteria bacterium]|nr:DUF975 family protein [Candidatus Nomurabacteria bacterium]